MGPIRVVIVSRLEFEKGVDYAYEWLATTQLNVRLVVCGRGRLSPPVDERIEHMGYVPDPLSVIARSHICLVLSRWENLSGSVLESLACATSVVHSGRGELSVLHSLSPERLMHRANAASAAGIDNAILLALARRRAEPSALLADAADVRVRYGNKAVMAQLEEAILR